MPVFAMGVSSLAATLLCLWLPETCGAPQPDSLRDFDALASKGNVLTRLLARRQQAKLEETKRLLATDVPVEGEAQMPVDVANFATRPFPPT